MPTLFVGRCIFDPIYELIGSKIQDEPTRAYAFDLYDAIERERVLRNNQVASGLKEAAEVTEAIRNRHISVLSKLMSTY
jgi:hypothetical protein